MSPYNRKPAPKSAPKPPLRKHAFAPGDPVTLRLPVALKPVSRGGRPDLAVRWRRKVGYVLRAEGHAPDGAPCYRVLLPETGGEPVAREGHLAAVPLGAMPVLLCKLPDGRSARLNYLDHRAVYLSGDDPTLPADWTPAERARWEGTVLARYYARHHPAAPREYWLGLPTGTCVSWELIDPDAPYPTRLQGGSRAAPRPVPVPAPAG